MGKIIAVCISPQKGTKKDNVKTATLVAGHGLENDAHAGNWHRQVSLLSFQKVEEFRQKGAEVDDGAFGENIVVDGIDLSTLPVGTLLKCGQALLKVTQIGKECHQHCEIYKRMGDCIMPREGIFAEVVEGGTVSIGDDIVVQG